MTPARRKDDKRAPGSGGAKKKKQSPPPKTVKLIVAVKPKSKAKSSTRAKARVRVGSKPASAKVSSVKPALQKKSFKRRMDKKKHRQGDKKHKRHKKKHKKKKKKMASTYTVSSHKSGQRTKHNSKAARRSGSRSSYSGHGSSNSSVSIKEEKLHLERKRIRASEIAGKRGQGKEARARFIERAAKMAPKAEKLKAAAEKEEKVKAAAARLNVKLAPGRYYHTVENFSRIYRPIPPISTAKRKSKKTKRNKKG